MYDSCDSLHHRWDNENNEDAHVRMVQRINGVDDHAVIDDLHVVSRKKYVILSAAQYLDLVLRWLQCPSQGEGKGIESDGR